MGLHYFIRSLFCYFIYTSSFVRLNSIRRNEICSRSIFGARAYRLCLFCQPTNTLHHEKPDEEASPASCALFLRSCHMLSFSTMPFILFPYSLYMLFFIFTCIFLYYTLIFMG